MAEISKQALQVANNTDFPNNNTGYITPSLLRSFNTDMIDSTVNQTVYTTNSGSWNQSISALNTFTSSQQPAFTALNAFTASQLSINSGLNAATQSLGADIASVSSEVDVLQTWSSSINEIRDDGILQGYSTRLYFTGLVSASITPNVGGAIATITVERDGTKLNTSSFDAYTSSVVTTSSFNAYTASSAASQSLYSASVSSLIDTKLNTSSFNAYTQSLNSGGFAITGSNVFIGDETFSDASGNASTLSPYSGSLVLVGKTFTSGAAALVHLSASANQVNLIFKRDNNTTDTIISGSNNIFGNQSATTAGFKRYVGNSNLLLGGFALPQLSSSMAWSPTVNGNMISHTQTNAITWRGPVSSSASNITHNVMLGGVISLGTAAGTHFEKAVSGTNLIGNALFNGNINATAYLTPLSTSVNITGNLVFGAQVNLNCNSSSMTYQSNVQNGGITINNGYTPIAGTGQLASNARITTNTVYGTGHLVNISGSNTATTQTKQFAYNILAGTYLSSSIGGGDNSAIIATGLIGNGLIITGSTSPSAVTAADQANSSQGSLFAGRFNAQDGSRAKTGETVFAVGTGTSYSARKTGLLIDSGSNVYVEGSLNISGSVYGNVVSASIVASTASIDLSKGSFFTLALVNGVTTNINITNPRPGTTALIQITNTGITSASFSSNVKQAQYNLYVPSSGSSIDLLSLQSFDSSSVFVTKALNFT